MPPRLRFAHPYSWMHSQPHQWTLECKSGSLLLLTLFYPTSPRLYPLLAQFGRHDAVLRQYVRKPTFSHASIRMGRGEGSLFFSSFFFFSRLFFEPCSRLLRRRVTMWLYWLEHRQRRLCLPLGPLRAIIWPSRGLRSFMASAEITSSPQWRSISVFWIRVVVWKSWEIQMGKSCIKWHIWESRRMESLI